MKTMKTLIAGMLLVMISVTAFAKNTPSTKAKAKKPTDYYAHVSFHDNGDGTQVFNFFLTATSSWTATKITVDTAIVGSGTLDFGGGYIHPVSLTLAAGTSNIAFPCNFNSPYTVTFSGGSTSPTTYLGKPILIDNTLHFY
jgi:hypothetical protein